ncbi:MAG: methylmalonyl Co-A mutase-associated GTPase MeaB [Flavobacteriales bacterium]
MEGNEASEIARQAAVNRIRAHQALPDPAILAAAVRSGDRSALSRAITLAESTHPDHRPLSNAVIHEVLPATGKSIRIGITGVPGVGKSTFIESFGILLAEKGHRIAVLAIDPSSPFTGGSILGDKTRMEKLSVHPQVFIRPTPSALTPGGVARHTRESIMLCEAAGYGIILVETVGVGQGEIAVHGMTDFFLLLMLAGAGDQLQGIKRGIMELCDGMLITKADGENIAASQRAQGDYMSALHLFPPRESSWVPRVLAISAAEHKGIEEAWQMISDHATWMKERGLFEAHRRQQDVQWFSESVQGMLFDLLARDGQWMSAKKELESAVQSGARSPFDAADELLQLARKRLH